MRAALSVLFLFVIALAPQAAALEPVRAGEYEHETFQTPHPYPSSGGDEPMLSWVDQVVYPGASFIALHFAHFELAEGDYVIVRSPDGAQSWRYERFGRKGLGISDGGFFATHIRGDSALIELYTVGEASGHGYTVDFYGRGWNDDDIELMWVQGLGEFKNIPEPPDESESLCGADDSREAKCYQTSEPEAYEKARATIRLLRSGSAWCTGWLVGDAGHAMTNEHCISSQSALNNIDFELMAEGPDCATNCASALACPGVIEASGGTFIRDSAPLDYALMIPDTSTANNTNLPDTYGFMRLRDSGAVLDERIYHPQHPAGWGKRIGMESTYPEDVAMGGFCYASSLTETPCSGGPGDVGYWTDTQGGSSGSPVLGYSDHRIIAIHHCRGSGFCSTGNPSVDDRNRGVPIDAIITDMGDDLPPGAICDAFDGPANLSAVPNGDNRIDLSWSVVSGPDISYNLYRAFDGCLGGLELLVDGLSGTSYTDLDVSGGTTYGYMVTATDNTNGCESDPSDCVEAEATGDCTRAPSFDGLETAANNGTQDCGITLGWSDATIYCGSEALFNVYRSEVSGFTPGDANKIAECVDALTYLDEDVVSGTDYFYIVRAQDDSGGGGPCPDGNEEGNTVELEARPSGPDEIFLSDDMESGSGNWTPMDGPAGGGTPWALVTTSSHSPTHSWFCSDQGFVKDQVLRTTDKMDLTEAASGKLVFWHRYNTESGFDGGVLEYSLDEGASWFDILDGSGSVPANPDRFLQNGYNDTLSTCCSNPIPGREAWSGDSGGWQEVIVDLTDFAGQKPHLRWRFGCDSSVSDEGWYVDDVDVLQGSECGSSVLFADGFESGDTSAWSVTVD